MISPLSPLCADSIDLPWRRILLNILTARGMAENLLANPVLYMVNAFRYGLLGVTDIPIGVALAIILLFIAGLTAFSLHLLNHGVGYQELKRLLMNLPFLNSGLRIHVSFIYTPLMEYDVFI